MVEIKNNKELSRYIAELKEDVSLTVSNLREKSLMCCSIRAKWLSYFYKERENLERIKRAKQELIQKKTASVNNNDSVLRLKREEAIIGNDETIKKLNALNTMTQENIDYIERALDVLSNFSFTIKNTTEILKLERQ